LGLDERIVYKIPECPSQNRILVHGHPNLSRSKWERYQTFQIKAINTHLQAPYILKNQHYADVFIGAKKKNSVKSVPKNLSTQRIITV
jgi:hypothetical protein